MNSVAAISSRIDAGDLSRSFVHRSLKGRGAHYPGYLELMFGVLFGKYRFPILAVSDIPSLIQRWQAGDQDAGEALWQQVYDQLRQIAGRLFADERDGHTLQPTALVNESLERLYRLDRINWQDRAHFVAMGAGIMRKVLIDHARRRNAAKRDWGHRVTLTGEFVPATDAPLDLLDLDEAMGLLAEVDEVRARVIELRYFGGLTLDEIAKVLEISPTTAKRHWQSARAWLYRRLSQPANTAQE